MVRFCARLGAFGVAALLVTTSCSLAVDLSSLNSDTNAPLSCSTPLADCNGKLDDGCETNLDSAPKSCGACGHDCKGAACIGGKCAPVLLSQAVDSAVEIALDDTNVYGLSTNGSVLRTPKAGGGATVLLSRAKTQDITRMVADGANLLWTENDGDGTTGFAFSQRLPWGQTPNGTPLPALPAGLASGDGAAFLGLGDFTLRSMQLGSTTPKLLATLNVYAWRMVFQGGKLFVAGVKADPQLNFLPGDIDRVDATNGAVDVLVPGEFLPLDVAVFDGSLFWVSMHPLKPRESSIKRLKLDCPTCAPEVLAANQPGAQRILVDATGIYWLNAENSPFANDAPFSTMGQVVRLKHGAKTPEVLAGGLLIATAIAMDDEFVYWANAPGLIQKVAK